MYTKNCVICKNNIATIDVDADLCDFYYNSYIKSTRIIDSGIIPLQWKIAPCVYRKMHKNTISNYEEFIIETIRSDKCFICGVNEISANKNTNKIICIAASAFCNTIFSTIMLIKKYKFFVIIFAGINTIPIVYANVLICNAIIRRKLIRNRTQHIIYSWWFFIFLLFMFMTNFTEFVYSIAF
jgi:hypothetical protein